MTMQEMDLTNLRDMMQTYNRMTESCFNRCVSSMNHAVLSDNEAICVNGCSGRHINTNHRIMATFVEIQSAKQQRMMEEAEQQQQQQQQQQPEGNAATDAQAAFNAASVAAAASSSGTQSLSPQPDAVSSVQGMLQDTDGNAAAAATLASSESNSHKQTT